MKWNLEELAEDAIVAYLGQKIPGTMRAYAAWDFDEAQYPCVIVAATEAGPVSEPAAWDDNRDINVQLAVMTEAAPEVSATGVTVLTTRERNIEARSAVMDALAVTDLLTQLNAQGVEAVAFSMAQMTTTQRSTEDRKLITTITLEVIAEPVTGS